MEIKSTTENGRVPVTIVQVSGNIDSTTYEAFQSKVNELIDGGARHILLDLKDFIHLEPAVIMGRNFHARAAAPKK